MEISDPFYIPFTRRDENPTHLTEFLKTNDKFDLIPTLKPIWNPQEKLWVPYIEELILSKVKDFGDLNDRAKNDMGESLLQFAGRTGKFHLSKVGKSNVVLSITDFILKKKLK